MPPRVYLFMACWAATAASSLFAQEGPPPGYSAPRARSGWDSEQQAFAQQYLAVPSGWASSGDRTASGRPADPHTHPEPSAPADSAALATDRESAFPSGFGRSGAADPAEIAADALPPEVTEPAADRYGERSDLTAGAFDGDSLQPPRLLPPPTVPPRPALVPTGAPTYQEPVPRDAPEYVVPAQHFHDDVSVPASHEAVSDPAAPDVPTAPSRAGPLPLAQPREALPLAPPGTNGSEGSGSRMGGLPSMVSVVGALAVVLGIFFVVAWGMRRAAPGTLTALPSQVVEVLGRAPLAGRQQVHLVRCGNKLLLVSVTPDAAKTLTEITDPLEVDRLAGLCEQMRPHSSSAAFRRVFQQYAHEGEGTHAS